MSELPFVSVIVVNFNGLRYLSDCLNSLANQTYPRDRIEVIVVDNASSDGSATLIREQFAWVHLIEQHRNVGFAAGNNVGIASARGEWIALLNNDAVAEPDWLLNSFVGELDGDVGGVASHIVFFDHTDRINSTGLILLSDGRGADRDFGAQAGEVIRARGDVFGGCGAAMLVRSEMLDEIGLFDPNLFMYYEDLDLACRAHRHGWRFDYQPTARVRHRLSATAGASSPFQLRYVERNRCLVNLRHAKMAVVTATILGALARLVRTGWRAITTRDVTRHHVVAHTLAVASVFVNFPRVLFQRWCDSAFESTCDQHVDSPKLGVNRRTKAA